MPVETTVTRCGNCGATLTRTPGVASITCGYCEQTTWLAPTAHVTRAMPVVPAPASHEPPRPETLHERLCRGPLGEAVGRGVRLDASQAAVGDPRAVAHALWPSGADASSTFGGSWSPSSMLGPPRVFPRYGDIGGAWAPAPRFSPAEWVEARFAGAVPVRAVRVFETNQAGSTYALLDVSDGEVLLYAGPVRAEGAARVLEVVVDPPRVITAVRAYVANPGWTELDTIGLVSAAPLPVAMHVPVPAPSGRGCFGVLIVAAVVAAVAAVSVVAFVAGRPAPAARHAAPVAQAAVAGGVLGYAGATRESLAARGVVWSSAVVERSSEYSTERNSASDVVGPPDVFPRGGDLDGAWASSATDGGEEWITVRFPVPVNAASIVWLETYHPGAVARVDDVSDGGATTLWQGVAVPPGGEAAAAELALPTPRVITALRLVLDTRRVAGWNEIDAIGLAPAFAPSR